MRRAFLAACMLLTAMLQSACCTPDAVIGLLPTPITGQQTPMWCWAASGEMTMNFQGAAVTQCDQATRQFGDPGFGGPDCCSTPTPTDCVDGGFPEYAEYGFAADVTWDAPLSWDDVKHEICSKRPFAFSWHTAGGGGHMMVVTGYIQLDAENYVVINDPLPSAKAYGGSQRVSLYDAYVSGPGYTHWNDYYNIRRR